MKFPLTTPPGVQRVGRLRVCVYVAFCLYSWVVTRQPHVAAVPASAQASLFARSGTRGAERSGRWRGGPWGRGSLKGPGGRAAAPRRVSVVSCRRAGRGAGRQVVSQPGRQPRGDTAEGARQRPWSSHVSSGSARWGRWWRRLRAEGRRLCASPPALLRGASGAGVGSRGTGVPLSWSHSAGRGAGGLPGESDGCPVLRCGASSAAGLRPAGPSALAGLRSARRGGSSPRWDGSAAGARNELSLGSGGSVRPWSGSAGRRG